MLRGTGVSAGVAKGTALVITCGQRSAAPRRSILASEVQSERSRFEAALARAASELVALRRNALELGSVAEIEALLNERRAAVAGAEDARSSRP